MMTHAIDNLILAMFVSFQIQKGCLPRKNEFSRRDMKEISNTVLLKKLQDINFGNNKH